MNSPLSSEGAATSTSPSLDFKRLSPLAVTMDKLLRHCKKTASTANEPVGLNEQMLRDLGSPDLEVKSARWRQLDKMLGGLNTTLVHNFQLLATEATYSEKSLTLPQFQETS